MTKKLNKENKPKLFEDYYNGSDRIMSKFAGEEMLNDLAQKSFDLEKDNDLLRGQITELTRKMEK